MAKLVEVYRNDGKDLLRRQLPLVVEENLVFVMELSGKSLVETPGSTVPAKEQEKFLHLFSSLTPGEVDQALQVDFKELNQILNQNITCIGCRRSVERLYWQLTHSGHPALDPICVTSKGVITLDSEYFHCPKGICSLFYGYSGKLSEVIGSQVRSKKRQRCVLHSLDSGAKVRAPWREVWDCMKPQVRDEVVLIEASHLMSTLENYLHKHRFCGECRTKVLRAYWLLVEEEEPTREKGYIPRLYAGIKRCIPDSHVHLPTNTDYISALIARVQPDLSATGGERHAKTLEIAQGEVITCLGLCVYERLHRIQLRLREEETTCQVLALVALDTLYRKFQMAVERKRGISTLEILCNELKQEELIKQQRKEQKKLKRKKRKERKACSEKKYDEVNEECSNPCQNTLCHGENVDPESINKLDLLNRNSECPDFCKDCGEDKKKTVCINDSSILSESVNNKEQCNPAQSAKEDQLATLCQSLNNLTSGDGRCLYEVGGDCGYSSGGHNNASSSPSSPEGSDVPCCEGLCNDEGLCNSSALNKIKPTTKKCHSDWSSKGFTLSLQDMLEDYSCSSDEESYIPIEDVKKFQSQMNIAQQREELRRNLRIKFNELCETKKKHPLK